MTIRARLQDYRRHRAGTPSGRKLMDDADAHIEAQDRRIEELERALRDAHRRLHGAGMLGGLDDPVRVVLEKEIRQAMGKAARAVLEEKS